MDPQQVSGLRWEGSLTRIERLPPWVFRPCHRAHVNEVSGGRWSEVEYKLPILQGKGWWGMGKARSMRLDVRPPDVLALGFVGWVMCEGSGPDGAYHLYPSGEPLRCEPHVKLIPDPLVESGVGISFAMLGALARLFETTNINVESYYEGRLSDVTPGNGLSVEIWIRPGAGLRIFRGRVVCMDHGECLSTVAGSNEEKLKALCGHLAQFGFQKGHADCGLRVIVDSEPRAGQ